MGKIDGVVAAKSVSDHINVDGEIGKWKINNEWQLKPFEEMAHDGVNADGFSPEDQDYVFQADLADKHRPKVMVNEKLYFEVSIDATFYVLQKKAFVFVILDIGRDDMVVEPDYLWEEIDFDHWPTPRELRDAAKKVVETELKRLSTIKVDI